MSAPTIDRTEQMAKDIIQERYGQPLKAAMILCEELEAALRAAQKDAERYRFPKARIEVPGAVHQFLALNNWHPSTDLRNVDEAIDKAMAAVIDSDAKDRTGMSVFLEHDHGWGQQRVAARLVWCQRTQTASNGGRLPLSVAGMRPSKTGTICMAATSNTASPSCF